MLPIVIPCIIVQFAPINVNLPICTFPQIVVPGQIDVKSLIVDSWSILQFVFTIQCFPILTSVWTTAPANITVPLLIIAFFETILFGCINIVHGKLGYWLYIFSRMLSLPIPIIYSS